MSASLKPVRSLPIQVTSLLPQGYLPLKLYTGYQNHSNQKDLVGQEMFTLQIRTKQMIQFSIYLEKAHFERPLKVTEAIWRQVLFHIALANRKYLSQ